MCTRWSAAFACFAVWLLSFNAIAAEPCICRNLKEHQISAAPTSRLVFDPEYFDQSDYTSFRGLNLSMTAAEAMEAVQRLDLELLSPHPAATTMEICNGLDGVGSVRFDQHGKINKLEFTPLYFAASKVHVREFADGVFQHYKVRPADDVDDVCFHDVTCFRGTTLTEKILILRIANDVQLHIMPRRSDLTQR